MSNLLHQYNTIESDITRLKRELEMLQSNPKMQLELEFKNKLEALMNEFGKTPKDVLSAIGSKNDGNDASSKRGPRPQKRYTNPHTGEKVLARSTNNKQIKAWKEKFGVDVVDSWAVEI